VEYAMIIAVLAIVAVGALVTLTGQTSSLYSSINSQLSRMGS
jgi:Flp pilus assembly pilin Flp